MQCTLYCVYIIVDYPVHPPFPSPESLASKILLFSWPFSPRLSTIMTENLKEVIGRLDYLSEELMAYRQV